MTKRILSLLLAVWMLIPMLAACNDTPDTPDSPNTPGSSDVSDTTPEDAPPSGLVLDKTDFGGAKLRILGISENVYLGYYATDDIWREADGADQFESAVYKRQQDCINKYKFSIEYTPSDSSTKAITDFVAGGLDQVDLAFGLWSSMFGISKTGNLLDMREMATIDLKNTWWDQNANESLCLANRLFYTTGEVSTIDDQCTRALYFNKTLAENKQLESPYTLVRSNQWTFDKFAEMCRSVYTDVDGEGDTDENDVIGFFYENGQFSYLMTAVGEKYATLDETGKPQYTWLQTSDAVTKLENVANLLIDDKVTMDINAYKTGGGANSSNIYAYARSKFAAGKHLFSIGGALVISEFADMEDEFGIVPMPKWNADQDKYYHVVETVTPLYGIPNTKTDTTDIGYMIEYFSYEGQQTVTPVYKENMLKRRYAPDADSADMLDIIYANRSFDVGYVCNWGEITSMGDSSVASGRAPKMASYNRAGKSVSALIDREYEAFLKVGKDTPAETPAE